MKKETLKKRLKVKDIRVGNLVSTDEIPSFIFGVNDFHSIFGNGIKNKQKVYGIPLTEEIARKFKTRDFTLIEEDFYDKGWHLCLDYGDRNYIGKLIKYVHEAQNMYFDLTGEELVVI